MLVRAMNEIKSFSIYVHCGLKFIPQFVKRGATWFFWINEMGGTTSQWKYTAKMENKETGMRVELTGSVTSIDRKWYECNLMNQKTVDKLENKVNHNIRIDLQVFQ